MLSNYLELPIYIVVKQSSITFKLKEYEMAKLKDFSEIKSKWLANPKIKNEYNKSKEDFMVAEEIIKARTKVNMTQADLAEKIGTKAPAISRLESPGYGRASVAALKKVAHALNCELQIKLVHKGRMEETKYTSTEKEVLFLLAIIEMIDSMVNKANLNFYKSDSGTDVQFKPEIQHYFYILLVDFLSKSNKKVLGEQLSYLRALENICISPHFNIDDSIKNLSIAVNNFTNWLEEEVVIQRLWLPTVEIEIDLSIKRKEIFYICGNIFKHNFSRLNVVADILKKIFNRNNKDVTFEDSLLMFDDLYEWFIDHELFWFCNIISEFLNNIRWGIHEYLLPEFHQSINYYYNENLNMQCYKYTYPNEIKSKFTKHCYWELMNKVRSKPYIQKFQIDDIWRRIGLKTTLHDY
jgi:transcriptional regulator with XRE-family HTH domain